MAEYLGNIVAIMHDAKRVLKDTGTLWIVIGDSYSRPAKFWAPQTDTRKRPDLRKHFVPVRTRIQGGDRPTGNLLMIPSRLAIALQDDGWILRQAIVWDKVWGRPEAVKDRATQTYEMIYMFVKKSGYFYDQDPLRVPSVSSHTTRSKPKAGTIRHDTARSNLRVLNNPLGHNAPSVWQIRHAGYVGNHPAAFPTELVRRIIVTACDTDSLVLDPFGGLWNDRACGAATWPPRHHDRQSPAVHRRSSRAVCPMRRLIAKLRTRRNRWNWQPIDSMLSRIRSRSAFRLD